MIRSGQSNEPQPPPWGGERKTAADHTWSMLGWFAHVGVDRADVAVRRRDGSMALHHDLEATALPLPWLRAQNVRQAEIYIRPARHHRWPLVLLDDVPVARALAVARKYDCLIVETSPAGGCHVWLTCTCSLDEKERYLAQRWLAGRIGSDLGSISGEHLGRLAGFKNWKRGGPWVNVLDATCQGSSWSPCALQTSSNPRFNPAAPPPDQTTARRSCPGRDNSESGVEWGWVCGMLEAGLDPRVVASKLASRSATRRGKDVDRYVRVTVARATQRAATRLKGGS